MLEQSPDTQQEGVVYPETTLIEIAAGQLASLCLQGGEAAREAARGLRGVVGVAGVVLKELGRKQLLDEEDDWLAVEDDRALTLDELFEEFGESNLEDLSYDDLDEVVMATGSILKGGVEDRPDLPPEKIKKVRELGFKAAGLRIQQIMEREEARPCQQVVWNTLELMETMHVVHPEACKRLLSIVSYDMCRRGGGFAGVARISSLGKIVAIQCGIKHEFSPEVEDFLDCIDHVLVIAGWYEQERRQRQQAASKEPIGVGDGSVSG